MAANKLSVLRVLPAIQHDKLYGELSARGWKRAPADRMIDPDAAVVSTWRHDDIEALVSWVDDRELSRHFYGLVYGPQAKLAVDRLLTDAWAITPERGIASLQSAATIEQLGAAARALGLLAVGPFNKDVFDVMAGMLASGNPALQMEALTGVMFSSWPQFESVLAKLAADEGTDEAVRAEAVDVIESQREANWNSELR